MDFLERRYQVFISSTFRDLQEERQKVLQAVLELRAFPSGMEMFPSADDEQWEFIKREIDSSDYYVVIVAGKYGTVAANGISYTEKEYDYAVETKKPVYAFLCKNLEGLTGAQLEDKPAKRKSLNRFRKKVSTNKLVKFYTNPDELKSQVLQALVTAFSGKPQEGWVRTRYARKMEDLDQINDLQRQIRRLEAENARLRENDLTSLLAQGSDTIEKTFRLSSAKRARGLDKDDKIEIAPPVEKLTISTTWDELLLFLFPGGLPPQGIGAGPKFQLLILLQHKTFKQYPESREWARSAVEENFGGYDVITFIEEVRLQLQGLGLIAVVVADKSSFGFEREETWQLTEKGKLRYALIAGRLRSSPKLDTTSVLPEEKQVQ